MVIPCCYYFADKTNTGVVPTAVLTEAAESWDRALEYTQAVPPAGWSSDWKRYPFLQNWVLPFPRWRTLAVDQHFHSYETWNRFVRTRLGSRGDIVPIMYNERKPDLVIFKIARRVYYFNRAGDDEKILALLCSVHELWNPAVLAVIYSRRKEVDGPSYSRNCDDQGRGLVKLALARMRLLKFLGTDYGREELSERSLGEDPWTWPTEQRKKIQDVILSRWYKSHKPMNYPVEDDEDTCIPLHKLHDCYDA